MMQLPEYDAQPTPNLFRSKTWLDAWHQAWNQSLNGNSSAAKEAITHFTCGNLAAYAYKDRLFKLLSIKTIYPEGKSSKKIPAIRNEYFQFPFAPNDHKSWEDFWSDLDAQGWDKILFDDILKKSADYSMLINQARSRGFTVLTRNEDVAFGINTAACDFLTYVKQLSKSTKIKLYNKRSKLNSLGKIRINNICNDKKYFINLLNEFHMDRWGKPCFSKNNEKMINYFLNTCNNEDIKLDFSVMTLDDIPVSVVFDIKCGNRIYNLQSGYKEKWVKGISLGTLHLGYQIEAAFSNPEVHYYDLMAGRGKKTNYKKSISNSTAEFASLAVFRKKWIPAAHRLKDQLQKLKTRVRPC
ncbi:MAG: GNAT family N-acetyltransferase [Pseudomonadota bacterium]